MKLQIKNLKNKFLILLIFWLSLLILVLYIYKTLTNKINQLDLAIPIANNHLADAKLEIDSLIKNENLISNFQKTAIKSNNISSKDFFSHKNDLIKNMLNLSENYKSFAKVKITSNDLDAVILEDQITLHQYELNVELNTRNFHDFLNLMKEIYAKAPANTLITSTKSTSHTFVTLPELNFSNDANSNFLIKASFTMRVRQIFSATHD